MKTIIIATDFSEIAANAVVYGAKLSHFFDARIILLHAFSLPVGGYDSITPLNVISDLQESSLKALENTKREIIKLLGFDPKIECIAEPGFASALIENLVKNRNIDAVVLGITGDAGVIKKHLIGSTVLELARDIEVPLFIIPHGVSFKEIKKITFAFDKYEEDNLVTFLAAKYFCKIFNAQLEILNVVSSQSNVEPSLSREDLDKLLSNVTHQFITIESDDTSTAIQHHIEKSNSDLLMLSPKRHHIFKNLFGTGITKHLVFSAQSPILTFHSIADNS
jgi:nucleotide-binding universal stress UspA family protein